MARLFVPFGDLTNNKETYGGGRYLDLTRTPTGYYEIDFNRAYHPNCVYDPTWVCPVPPRENRLDVAIPAGERLPASYKRRARRSSLTSTASSPTPRACTWRPSRTPSPRAGGRSSAMRTSAAISASTTA